MLGKPPPAKYWPAAKIRFSSYYSEQAWINVQKVVFIAQKEGCEETGKSKFKKLPKYLLSMREQSIDHGINSGF